MNDEAENILAGILSSIKSGRVSVSVDRKTAFTLESSDDTVSIRVPSDRIFSWQNLTLRETLTDLRMLKKLSAILRDSSVRVEVFMDSRKVFSMGKGVSSFLGNERVNFLNLLRSSSKR